jgi:triosephosphate isomerase
VGETGQERKDGETKRVIHDQLTTALSNLTAHDIASMVVAYEPVWAIGSGQPEKPADTREVCGYIRSVIHDLYGEAAAQSVRLLYGGSVTPEVAKPFLSEAGVDGFLVGHESLNWHDFSAIIDEAYAWK